MSVWIGIAISAVIGAAGLLLAWKSHRLASSHEERLREAYEHERVNWKLFARQQPDGLSGHNIELRFEHTGRVPAYWTEFELADLSRYAVLDERANVIVNPGESISVTIRHDPTVWERPKRLRVRWRPGMEVKGDPLEAWVDTAAWGDAIREIQAQHRGGSG